MNGLPKVNASVLPEHVGKLVCLVGKVSQIGQDGTALKLISTDQKTINISLKDKCENKFGDFVQIIGTVQQDLSVIAEKCIGFDSTSFCNDLYNKLVTKILPQYPHIFQMSATTKMEKTN